MIRESLFYKILSSIHIVLFTSVLCFGTIVFSGTLLTLPALGAAFLIGRDQIYGKLDISDSIIKTYFKYLKSTLKLMRFIPVNLVMYLNVVGMVIGVKSDNLVYSVICLALFSFLIVFMLYIAGYYTFISEKVGMVEVVFSMFIKPQFIIPVFIIVVLCAFFFSGTMAVILCLCGSFFLFVLEVIIFLQMLYYRNMLGQLDEEEEFAYLINRSVKSNSKA